MKLVTVAEMQRLEAECGVPVPQLMENAGLAVAQEAWLNLGEIAERRILVLCGPGNNGGDGLVAARCLKDWAADVIVFLLQPRPEDDANQAALVEREVPLIVAAEDGWEKRLTDALGGAELVIDALLGTGRARAIGGDLATVLTHLKEARARAGRPPRLIAVDLPTGLNADTGAADPLCVAADSTVALGFAKVGLHVLPGADYAGSVETVDIGIPAELAASVKTELIGRRWAQEHLPERPADAHKGTFGSAMVVAGSLRYTGAAYLACSGAMRAGAGLVTLACARSIHPIVAARLSEATFEPLDDTDGELTAHEAHSVVSALGRGYESLLIGPGLSQSGYVQAFLRGLLPALTTEGADGSAGTLRAVVIDADGLNNLARIEDWPGLVSVPAVLTPHPGEMARLSGLTVAEVQADRLGVARKYAAEWDLIVLLKGAPSIVAAPDGRAAISPFVNPALASAGTGDVLAGTIAGFIAQGVDPFAAACLGLYVGGLAGEALRREFGSAGVIAGDLLPAIPKAMRDLRGESRPETPGGARPDLLQMLQQAQHEQEGNARP